jgi:NAD(P)-dependent dehydrogenase (short-subunit alcohol dehydrogenase family)
VASLWKSVKETFGKADVLVNNAGILTPGNIADTPVETWWGDFVRTSPTLVALNIG